MLNESSPLGTPTTPCTPPFAFLAPSPTSSPSRRSSICSIRTVIPAQSASSSFPLSPVAADPTYSIPITRPLGVRAALQNSSKSSHSCRVSKPSQQQQQQQQQRQQQTRRPRRRSFRGRFPPLSQLTFPTCNVSPRGQRPTLPYANAVSHLSTTLIPLISVATGLPHPAFPRSLLEYHLLTHGQLDELAVYYHQVAPPIRETSQYPVAIPAWLNRDGETVGEGGLAVALETKRRRWGRFLGLRGCESPTGRPSDGGQEERELRERLEREWSMGVERKREEERLREKAEGWRARW